jgi:hypothetical protein
MADSLDSTPRRKHPFLASFFKAVLRFKGLARKARKWRAIFSKATVKNYQPLPGERSEFSKEVNKSQKHVEYAKAGAPVITLQPEKLQEYTQALIEKKKKLKTEKIKVLKQIRNRRRFGKTTIFKSYEAVGKSKVNLSRSAVRVSKQLEGKLNAMSISNRFFNLTKEEQHKLQDTFIGAKVQKTVSDFEYMQGTNFYFGSDVCLQARHGGFLSYANTEILRASAPRPTEKTRFRLLNCDDLSDNGALTFGQAILLQTFNNEFLGANFGSGYGRIFDMNHILCYYINVLHTKHVYRHMVNSTTRKIEPVLMKMQETDPMSMLKAHQYGRWIILKKDDPIGSTGQPVSDHADKIF